MSGEELLTAEEEMSLWQKGVDMSELTAMLLEAGCSEDEMMAAIDERRKSNGVN